MINDKMHFCIRTLHSLLSVHIIFLESQLVNAVMQPFFVRMQFCTGKKSAPPKSGIQPKKNQPFQSGSLDSGKHSAKMVPSA